MTHVAICWVTSMDVTLTTHKDSKSAKGIYSRHCYDELYSASFVAYNYFNLFRKKLSLTMYDLERFTQAQARDYEIALNEIKAGRKQSHWIWYIFPQIKNLGHSYNARYYGLENLDEAKSYLSHPVLGKRLIEISEALLTLPENDPVRVMNSDIDAMKLKSSMTIFVMACEEKDSIFHKVLAKFFDGQLDNVTLNFIREKP